MSFVDDMCRLSETFINMEKKLRDLKSEGWITRLQIVRNWVTQNKRKKWQNIQKELWMYRRSKQIFILGHCYGQQWCGWGRCKNIDSGGKLQLLLNLIEYGNVGRCLLQWSWEFLDVMSSLFYCIGAKHWKVTNSNTRDLQIFIRRCIRQFFNIFWLNVLSNR